MTYDVQIRQLELMALFDLKGEDTVLSKWCGEMTPPFPTAPLTYEVKAGRELMAVGPDHWILRAPIDQEKELAAALKPDQAPDDISIVPISDTLNFFEVTGPETQEIMAVASPLDLHIDLFPANGAAFSEVFSTKSLIIRIENGFHLGVDRSYAPMIADYLTRAIAD